MEKVFYKTQDEIENWLNQYNIKNYKLILDEKYGFLVDVDDNVNLYKKILNWIPVKFNIITGYFDCGFNMLKSLEFSPKVVGD